jgi:alpha-beta hydrolase superfamily lysophospholipase
MTGVKSHAPKAFLQNSKQERSPAKEHVMNTITTKDGVEIYYKDWGPKNAQPNVFHHGWPLSADDWDTQLLYFLGKGYRVVAHDRRGHGRSEQVSDGHDMDHYAADAAAVFEHLDLKNAVSARHVHDPRRCVEPRTARLHCGTGTRPIDRRLI